MASNTSITNTAISTGYVQLLHVGDDSGIHATTNRTVYDGDGTATALSISTANVGAASGKTLLQGGVEITSTAAELNILDGVTSSTAELNIMDGVTSTTAELNIMDGVTSTAAELNILDGVTATAAELNIIDGVTSTTAELNIMDGVTSTTAELNILDGVTSTAAELNILDGVTASTAEINQVDGITVVSTTGTQTLTNKTLTSPTVSGLTLSDSSIIFEGATADTYETTLTVVDPTADRTITIQNASDTLVGRDTTDTLTNKTLTSPVLNTSVSGTAIKDEDTMTSDSNLHLATQQSIKAYVDSQAISFGGLSNSDGNFIVGNGSAFVAESGATARTSLGLGSLATASTINNGDWSGTDLAVGNGGTGISDTPANGTLLIGNGTNYTNATLSAGSNVSISVGSGSISIASSDQYSGTVTSIATSGAISGGTITSTGTITHSTANGYKHIPATGSSGKFLGYASAGTASWQSLPEYDPVGGVHTGAVKTTDTYSGGSPSDNNFLSHFLRKDGAFASPTAGVEVNNSNWNGDDLAVGNGGTGLSDAPTEGQLLIGTDAAGYSTANLSAGSNVTITNASGSITIASTDTDTNTNQLTTFTLTGDSGSNQTIAHGNTLDIAGGTGISTVVSATDTVTVSLTTGHLSKLAGQTSPTADRLVGWDNSATDNEMQFITLGDNISMSGTTVNVALGTINNTDWSGEDLAPANGGTGASDVPAAGNLLIGNGTNNDYEAAALTAGSNVTITNADASITIASTDTNTNQLTTFTLTGDSGTNQTIAQGNTLDIEGGTGISTVVGATDTVTVSASGTLADIALLGVTDSSFIVGDGSNFVLENAATSRTSLGLGSLATASTINNGDWSGTDLAVGNGGTGISDAPANGTMLIGSGTAYVNTALTEGDNVTITVGAGSCTIASTDTDTTYTAGDGLTLTGTDFDLDAGLTTVTSIYNTSLKVGRDSGGDWVDFGTNDTIKVYLSNAEEFRFASGGSFHADADITAYSTTVASDLKLKKNIKPINYGLKEVMELNPVQFDWKRDDRGHDIGFVAQDVESIISEVVKDNDGIRGEFKSVDYARIVAVLVKSIQELKAELDGIRNSL